MKFSENILYTRPEFVISYSDFKMFSFDSNIRVLFNQFYLSSICIFIFIFFFF